MEPFKNLGYTPPVQKDPRNWLLESTQPVQPFPDTHVTDITPFKLPQNIYMQYQIPDCVENAVAFAQRYDEWKATGIIPNLCRRELAIKTVQADGFPFSAGTNLQVALDIAHKQGIGDAQYFPDDHTLDEATFIGASLPQTVIDSAQAHKIPSYAFVSDLSVNGLKNAIYQNGIVLIGIKVSDWWWTAPSGNASWQVNDILPIRPIDATHPQVSGHAVALYGYDTQYFYFMNWWSPQWGDQGHGWFGINDVPEIYEAAVIGAFIKPTTPAPEPAPSVPQASTTNVLEEVVQMAEQVVETVIDEIKSVL